MAKRNLSTQQANRINQLSFFLSDYIQAYHNIQYIKFLEEGNRKGAYALKDDIFNVLKCVYIPSYDNEIACYHKIQKYVCDEYLAVYLFVKNNTANATKYSLKKLADITAIKTLYFDLLTDARIEYD